MTMEPTSTRPTRALAGATVLQVVQNLRDEEAGRAALDLAVALLRAGARALVAGRGGPLVGELQALGGEWMEVDVQASGLFRRRDAARKLAAIVTAERVDLVHARGAAAARVAAPAVRGNRAAFVTTYVGAPPPPGRGRTPADAQAQGAVVLAPSDFAAGWISHRHGVGRERIALVPPCVDTDWFDNATLPPGRVEAIREAWRVRPDARMVLAPGRLTPETGHYTLVDAARQLVNGGLRGVVFVIAGHRPEPGYAVALREHVDAMGLGGIFRLVGECRDMPAAYGAADFVVLPTERAATFDTMAVEAQAMARPVIASALGSMLGLVLSPVGDATGPRSGWLVPPADGSALARALAEALSMPRAQALAIGNEGRGFARAIFSPDETAAATLAIYENLLRRADPA